MGKHHILRPKPVDATAYWTGKCLALVAYMVERRDATNDMPYYFGEMVLNAATYDALADRGFTRNEIERAINRLGRICAIEMINQCNGAPYVQLVQQPEEVGSQLLQEENDVLYGHLREA